MSRESTIVEGRARAEEAMLDTVRWERQTGHSAQDEDTGYEGPVYEEVFTGPAKIALGALRSLVPTVREQVRAGGEITELRSVVHVPIGSPPLEANDIGTVIALGPVSDPVLLGKQIRLVGPIGQSYGTARRFSIEEVLP